MKKSHKYFPSQRETEEVFLLLRRHWFAYVPFAFIALIMSLPLVFISLYWTNNPEVVAGIVGDVLIMLGASYLLFVVSLLLYGFIDYYLDVDIITDQRIVDIEQNGFFRRKIAELSLNQVEDVAASVNGPFQTLLHFGDIHIQTAGTKPNFVFNSIPHPYRISKIILDLHDADVAKTAAERNKILSGLGEVSDSSLEDKRLATNAPGPDAAVEPAIKRVIKPVSEKLLAGVTHDEAMAKITDKVQLSGEMKEGEAIDLG
ncbi:MAG: PH domain-containing protein [Patescibacteria group bacterium]